jgi:hypothetical protein
MVVEMRVEKTAQVKGQRAVERKVEAHLGEHRWTGQRGELWKGS